MFKRQAGGGNRLKALVVTNIRFRLPEKRSLWNYFEDLMLPLSEYPIDIDAFISGQKELSLQRKNIRVTDLGMHLPGIVDDMNLGYLFKTLRLKDKIDEMKPSLIHHFYLATHGMNSFDVLAAVKKTNAYPIIIGPAEVSHVLEYDDYRFYARRKTATATEYSALKLASRPLNSLLRFVFRQTLSVCEKLVVPNTYAEGVYSDYISRKKIVVIPPGIRSETFHSEVPPNDGTVLLVGSLISRKGQETAIRAMKGVVKTIPHARLRLVGDGPNSAQLMALVRDLDLTQNVEFCGMLSRDDFLRALTTCNVFCHTSVSEAYSHVILEAISAGRPIVCTNIPGSRDMVEEAINGFMFKPGDYRTLGDRLIEILSNTDLAFKMGMASSRHSKKYDWTVSAKKYFDLYREVGS